MYHAELVNDNNKNLRFKQDKLFNPVETWRKTQKTHVKYNRNEKKERKTMFVIQDPIERIKNGDDP